jgi:hypothetical protein
MQYMKRLVLIGGIIGFLIGVGLGLCTEGASWPGILVRAALTCLIGGILLRWWGSNWVDALREVQNQHLAAMAKAQETSGTKAPWKK